ncbi:MAG: hypothetical protein FWD40_11440 [Treponema sp.]|nr:hypothetical protein [Treponema sp.]
MNILQIVSIVCFALCLIIFFYLKWYVKKRTSNSGLEEHKTELYRLMAEIERITDRDLQLVEDRVNKLKLLLLDVDKRIKLYENDLENMQQSRPESKKNETLYTSLGKGIRAALDTSADAEKKHQESGIIEFPVQNPAPSPHLFENNISAFTPPPAKPPSKKQIRAYIDMLANEGLPAQEIASRLEISIAEVNLAMNLRRKDSN